VTKREVDDDDRRKLGHGPGIAVASIRHGGGGRRLAVRLPLRRDLLGVLPSGATGGRPGSGAAGRGRRASDSDDEWREVDADEPFPGRLLADDAVADDDYARAVDDPEVFTVEELAMHIVDD
jgi:hypothetical protein